MVRSMFPLVSAGSALLTVSSSFAAGPSYQRPLSDFLDAQGTTSVQAAPVPDYLAWTDIHRGVMMSIDYAGLANAWTEAQSGGAVSYGTTISGTVRESVRADGRADVQIIIHARDALSWVVAYDSQGPNFADVRFGSFAPTALATGDAALGECVFQAQIVNTAPNAPLPDLFDAFVLGNAAPGVELRFLSFNGRATGTLQAGAIPGVPAGTAGRATVIQTGLLMTGFHGAVGDGFPAEQVRLNVAP